MTWRGYIGGVYFILVVGKDRTGPRSTEMTRFAYVSICYWFDKWRYFYDLLFDPFSNLQMLYWILIILNSP